MNPITAELMRSIMPDEETRRMFDEELAKREQGLPTGTGAELIRAEEKYKCR